MSWLVPINRRGRNAVARSIVAVGFGTLVAGMAMSACAEPASDAFADTFARMQALSSDSAPFQRDTPAVASNPVERVARLSIREMQALSSDAPAWQIEQGASGIDRGPTFGEMHPRGLSFAEYQSYATNSSEFALPSAATVTTMTASAPSGTFARSTTLR